MVRGDRDLPGLHRVQGRLQPALRRPLHPPPLPQVLPLAGRGPCGFCECCWEWENDPKPTQNQPETSLKPNSKPKQNQPKTNPKISPNNPQTNLKSTQNHPKNNPKPAQASTNPTPPHFFMEKLDFPPSPQMERSPNISWLFHFRIVCECSRCSRHWGASFAYFWGRTRGSRAWWGLITVISAGSLTRGGPGGG